MVARACDSIYASWVIAAARTGLPGSCGRAAGAPGRSVVSGLAPPTAAIVTRSRKTGWQKVPAPDRPGQLWQSDITYIETQEGWLYLAFTLDGCSRRCIAHTCRRDMLGELTTTTFKHAATRKGPLVGVVHHSDRGSQYAADAFQHCLRAWGVTPSMSRKGNPYDNALAESFVATLKTECFADSIPPTKAAAKLMIFDYIESFYNPRRRHSALGDRSPAQFEHHLLCSQRQGCSGGGSLGGETCLTAQVGSSRPGCKQLPGVVQAAGNNPVQSPKGFQCSSQNTNLN